jgi:hypothetical protein
MKKLLLGLSITSLLFTLACNRDRGNADRGTGLDLQQQESNIERSTNQGDAQDPNYGGEGTPPGADTTILREEERYPQNRNDRSQR